VELDSAAALLAQLGHRARLEVMRLLIRAGPAGLPVGEVQAHLGLPASTLAFHLRGLVSAGLVEQEREGRVVLCRPRLDAVDGIVDFLRAECCRGVDAAGAPGRDRAA
jgi:ArsR family transcriptional regulator